MADMYDGAGNKRFLTKDEELAIGILIQDHYAAKEELANNPNLTTGDRAELEERVARGIEATDTLVRANLRLVYLQANRFKSRFPQGPEVDDLVQDGMVGLMTAVSKYDPVRGNKFSTMALSWINQALSRHTNNTHRLVRLPENRVMEMYQANRISTAEENQGKSPSEIDRIIMDKLNVDKTTLADMRSAGSVPVSLNRPVGSEDGAPRELMDVIGERRSSPSPDVEIVRRENERAVAEAIGRLPDVERAVVMSTFSFDDDSTMTKTSVCKKFGLSSSQYRSVLGMALSTLRVDLGEFSTSISMD